MPAPGILLSLAAAVPILLAALAYRAGAIRRARIARAVPRWRHYLFGAGLGLLLIAVEPPIALWARRLFAVQQTGIMLARMVAPMLIAASRPAGLLIAGTPRRWREGVLKPALGAAIVRRTWPRLAHPAVALTLYVALFYLWESPPLQALAVRSSLAAFAMYASLLATGLLFWTRIFARRAEPHEVSHGQRLMMVWLSLLTQVLIGAALTIPETPFYPAYAAGERLMGVLPLLDQQRGGAIIWLPGAFLSLAALILAVDQWGRHETRLDEKRRRWTPSNSAILLYPETARALRAMTRTKNRRLALGLGGFTIVVFGWMIGMSAGAHQMDRAANLREYQLSRS